MFLHYLIFFFNDPATTDIYTLSLHDALPISGQRRNGRFRGEGRAMGRLDPGQPNLLDRKSTRLISSHLGISYAVFCLKKNVLQEVLGHLDGFCLRVGFQDGEAANAFFFFFNDTATTEIYTLSLHDALPI